MSENIFHWGVLILLFLILIQLIGMSSLKNQTQEVMERMIDNLSLKLNGLISLMEVESMHLEDISKKLTGVHERFLSKEELKRYYDSQP